MRFQSFLLTIVLSLSSVSAIPNPNAGHDSLVARNGGGQDCGNQASWDHGKNCCVCKNGQKYNSKTKSCYPQHDCGNEASWDSGKNCCECKNHGEVYNPSAKSCSCPGGQVWTYGKCACPTGQQWNGKQCKPKHDCGKEASWDKNKNCCVCKNHGEVYDSSTKTCSCPGGQVWTYGKCACPSGQQWNGKQCKPKHNCGNDAKWNDRKNCCVCKKNGQVFNPTYKTCACPSGKKWNGWACVTDCGNDASYNNDKKCCVCKKEGEVYNPTSKTCACPGGQVWTYGKCACPKGQDWDGKKCKPHHDCGNDATWKDNKNCCVCKKDGEVFNPGSKTCACPGGKVWSYGKCVCPTGQDWDGKKCKPHHDCGNDATWNDNKNCCVCKKQGEIYNPGSKTCACPGGQVWSYGKCVCPTGQDWDGKHCKPHHDCGNDATWSDKKNCCVCKKDGEIYNPGSKTCACPGGQVWTYGKCACPTGQDWDGKKCKPHHDCGNDATWSDTKNCCVCKKDGEIYNAGSKTCACPGGQVWTYGKCACPTGQDWDAGLKKCKPHHDCGNDASWDDGKNCCVCKKEGEIFNPGSKTCACPGGQVWSYGKCVCPTGQDWDTGLKKCKPHHNCGKDATWSDDKNCCVCKNNGEIFNPDSKTCACPGGQVWTYGKCACPTGQDWDTGLKKCKPHHDCGNDAAWSDDKNCCVCKKEGEIFNPDSKTCACPGGQVWTYGKCACPNGQDWDTGLKKCKPHHDCGNDATWDDGKNCCVCKKDGEVFNPGSKTCACPGGQVWTYGKCACPNGQDWDTGSKTCKPHHDCGNDATWSDSKNCCVCKNEGQIFNPGSKTCACPGGQVWTYGKCACPNGQDWDTGSKTCKPHHDCGNDATWSDSKNCCVCKNDGEIFNPGSKTCACPGDQVWTYGKCACPNGQDWDTGSKTCKPHHDCGNDATWNDGKNCCVCKNEGQVFNPGPKTCTCPGGQVLTYGKCACPKGQAWDNGSKTCKPSYAPPRRM